MAKKVVRYLLEADGSVPIFIENGGYFLLGEELVGLTIDSSKRHVPSTLIQLSRAELKTRAFSLGLKDFEGNFLTEQQVSDKIDGFLTELGLPDYL